MNSALIRVKSCPKSYERDLDKAVSPAETIANVRYALKACDENIFAGVRRVDTGRLGIPVYLGICGDDAKAVMPTRKQMGKGSSPEQAEASAIMELMERYAFFSFFDKPRHVVKLRWRDARSRFGSSLIPVGEMLRSVNDGLPDDTAEELLNLLEWQFYPATELGTGEIVWLPLDWFRMLGEFNGSAAGNTAEESLLQGLSELVERHVCCLVDERRPTLATVRQDNLHDDTLKKLCTAFERNGVRLILKDMSLGMPLPTVGAIAWDPATFPADSEIVFTAGTASSPAKAAIRAVTEVAQLGGDFCTHSCYEASGLPKFSSLSECEWLLDGPVISLDSLPDASSPDICDELVRTVQALSPIRVFAVETTHTALGIPAHWVIAPGLQFRERDKNQSLGLFIGRKLAEEVEPDTARAGLKILAQAYPDAHFLPFFHGLLTLREGDADKAAALFADSIPLQPSADAKALAAFYAGYALSQMKEWAGAVPHLKQAMILAPAMKEAANLLGVCYYKMQNYAEAERAFSHALAIDKGSAMDLANRGIARQFQGKRELAIHDLEAALELDASLGFARKHLHELYGEQV